MADYAGAVAAIRQRLIDNWTTTPIALQNVPPPDPFPPINPATGNPGPWVLLEVVGVNSAVRAAGVPGAQFWLYDGLVLVHVFTPTGSGIDIGQQLAAQIGEIFRNKTFYQDGSGNEVRTISPRTDGGDKSSDDKGEWWRVTMAVPFEFYLKA